MAQAADTFLDLVGKVRSMRRAATSVSIRAGLPNGVDSICTLFFASKVGGPFYGSDVTTICGFNACVSIRTLLALGLIEDVGPVHIDKRRRPIRLTDKGRHVVAQLEEAMAPSVERERAAA